MSQFNSTQKMRSYVRHLPFILHLVVLTMVSYVVFRQNTSILFIGYDGAYNLMKIKSQFAWMPPGLFFGSNPLQEFSNVFMAHNCWLFPCYLFAGMLRDGVADPVIVYTTSSVFLFFVSYITWRCYDIDSGTSLAASWIVCLITLPLIRPGIGYGISGIVPHYSSLIGSATLACALFNRIGKGTFRASLLFGICTFLVFLHSTTAAPAVFSLAIPVYLSFTILSFLTLQNKRELKFKAIFILLFAVVTVPTIAPYLLGTVLNTVPVFFANELLDMRRTIEFTSVLFVDHFTGGILLLFSVGGSLVCLSRRAKNVIPLAILNLIAWLMFLFTGLIITYVADHYVGPSPRDFELFYYPLYSLFAAYAFIFIVQKSRDILSSALSPNRTSKTYALDSWFPTGLLLAVVLLLYSLSPIGRGATGFEWPMQDTVLGNKLVSSIGLGGGGRYNGTVVTITRKGLPESAVSWADQVGVDCAYTRRVGNDFRALGLWRLNVSTVFAYNQLITPQFYAMTTRFLSRPIDPQIRNVVTLTNLNIDYLASLGVRYAIVDGYVPNLHEDITNGKIIPLPEFNFSGDNYPGYLYEIQKPNIGTFYPVHQVVTSSGEEAAAIMSDPSMPFNYQNSVVVTERIPEPLVTADPAVLTFKRDGLHIKAHSNGTSILLLPLQYSHCLSIKTISVGAVKPKIVRANVMQVALLFSGTVELVVSFRYGPFENQFGRIKDFLDMQKLGIDAIAFIKTKS